MFYVVVDFSRQVGHAEVVNADDQGTTYQKQYALYVTRSAGPFDAVVFKAEDKAAADEYAANNTHSKTNWMPNLDVAPVEGYGGASDRYNRDW